MDKVIQMCQGIFIILKMIIGIDVCIDHIGLLIVKLIHGSRSMDCNTPTQYLDFKPF